VTNCGPGYYGEALFSDRGNVISSKCMSCHSSCAECVGSGSNMCTACKGGSYLERWTGSATFGTGSMKSYGTCIAKTVFSPGGVFTRDVWVVNERQA
jgi:hypothetical protein